MAVGKAHRPPGYGDPGLQVADEGLLIDAVAVGEGIAVEEDIAQHGTAFHPGEQIPAEAVLLQEETRSRQARPDTWWTIIRREVLAESQGGAGCGIGENVAEASAEVDRKSTRLNSSH